MTPEDERQLRVLTLLHYVAAILAAPVPLVGAAYGSIGVATLLGKINMGPSLTDRMFGLLPAGLGLVILVFGVAFVIANALAARSLRSRTRHTLCLITATANCIHIPFGTLLGLFALNVLNRPSVRAAFEANRGSCVGPSGPSSPSPPAGVRGSPSAGGYL